MAVAVDQRDPGATVFGVTPFGLVEHAPDHRAGVLDDAGAQPCVGSDRPGGRLVTLRRRGGEDVGHRARRRRRVVDRADLRHPLAVALILAR